ncbi:cold shock domain-containing protein [Thermoleptolyngbya sp. C42_A2020_037]|uniref:redoxin domain-containing protein n=1 Tax=Thermoleptolyngbya sp. C42_A2020_037 TaxID=2747799 RepID=UPI001A024665|nr:cold shock domain-containing protein [Thermoleptolyngbya sp. C42_A2020_037]MBF2083661.1 cold shock domain-containing protein [Thermoleptolyngbya sp. C42_A2020_037]
MTTTLTVGDRFPDVTLPNQDGEPITLSSLTQPALVDHYLGFADGYPLILVFYRGFFCPRDRQQLPQLVQFQSELAVNYCKLATVSVDPPIVQAAFRAGLGAQWPFLCDEGRSLLRQINILDETEGEYAYRPQPYTFVLRPDLTIYSLYNGWFFVGRPTLEELRQDLRAIIQTRVDYRYEAYDTPEVRQIRIPQQTWATGAPPLGESGLPVLRGVVRWFDLRSGNGMITRDDGGEDVFFNFTAIPGAGYRTLAVGTAVQFELIKGRFGDTARNVQKESPSA